MIQSIHAHRIAESSLEWKNPISSLTAFSMKIPASVDCCVCSGKMPTVFSRALPVSHHYQTLITLFDSAFFTTFNTRLVKGDDEPFTNHHYMMAIITGLSLLTAFTSALHEIAHWCLAGRRDGLSKIMVIGTALMGAINSSNMNSNKWK